LTTAYFDPDACPQILQILFVFFSTYCAEPDENALKTLSETQVQAIKKQVGEHRTVIEHAFIPILRFLLDEFIEKKINIQHVAESLLDLVLPRRSTPQNVSNDDEDSDDEETSKLDTQKKLDPTQTEALANTHLRMGINLALEVLSNPKGIEGKTLSKVFAFLHVDENSDQDLLKSLAILSKK